MTNNIDDTEAQASKINWKKVYGAITNPWVIIAFFGILGWVLVTKLENYVLLSSATTHWEWIQNIASKEAVMVIEIPAEGTGEHLISFPLIGAFIVIGLIFAIANLIENSNYEEVILGAAIAFLLSGWLSTIFTAFTSDVAESSRRQHHNNLQRVYQELEAAPPEKKFVYDKIVYDGRIAAAVLKKEFAK